MTRKPAEQFGTTTVRPPDFDDFWAAIMAEANAIPLNPTMEHVPNALHIRGRRVRHRLRQPRRPADRRLVLPPEAQLPAAAVPGPADCAGLHLGADPP